MAQGEATEINPITSPVTTTPTAPQEPIASLTTGLYDSPATAEKAVREDFLYWSGKLTDTSFELSIAILAANWAVFGSVSALLSNLWSQLSVAVVVATLAVNLVIAWKMSQLHQQRIAFAEENPERWTKAFEDTKNTIDPYPFTRDIERLGRFGRLLRLLLPLLGGGLFVIALARA